MSYPAPPGPTLPGSGNLKTLSVETLQVTGDVDVEGNVTVDGDVTAVGNVTGVGLNYSSKGIYTQLTSATTAVPVTTNAGSVTTQSLTTATTATTVFTMTGAVFLSSSQVMLTDVAYSGTPLTNGIPVMYATSVVAGTATITVANYGANALAGTLTFNYIIV